MRIFRKRTAREKGNTERRIESRVFLSIFRSILTLIPVPVLLILVAELGSVAMMENMTDNFEMQTISRVLEQVEQDFQQSYVILTKLRSDEELSSYASSAERDYYKEWEIRSRLQNMMSGYSNIEEIYVYFPQYEYVLSTSYGGKESSAYQQSHYKGTYEEWCSAISSGWKGVFRTLEGADGETKNIVSTSIGYVADYNTVQAVVQLSNEYLQDILEGLSLQEKDAAFVVSENGIVASTLTLDSVDEELAEQLLNCCEEGTSSLSVHGVDYFLRFAVSSNTGLTLVYAIAKGSAYLALNYVKIFGAVMVLLGTVVLVLLAFRVADKTYTPYRSLTDMVKESDKELEQYPEQDLDDWDDLESYLRRNIHSKEEMRERLKQYEQDMNLLYLERILFQGEYVEQSERMAAELDFTGAYYAVMMCMFEGAEENTEICLTDAADGKLDYREIVSEYIQEEFSGTGRFYVVKGKENVFCIFNGDASDSQQFCRELSEKKKRVEKKMAETEGLFCDFYLSKGYESLYDIHDGYEQVTLKSLNRVIQDKTDTDREYSIDRIVAIIKSNLQDDTLSVSGIADKLEISPSHLSRYFKEKMNTGVLEYIHQCRVELAKDILKTAPEIRIREVASRTGFNNITTFNRVFKKIEGITPAQYREMFQDAE